MEEKIIALLFGYLLGSIPFGVVLTKLAGTGDLRAIGSGNIGATNVLRTGRKDLAIATVVYAICNSILHHAIWSMFGSEHLIETNSTLWMLIGDLNGALLGAYLFKASLDYLEKKGFNFSEPSQSKN
jgi:glycerol-3-phosphate acyltransferase PlsY